MILPLNKSPLIRLLRPHQWIKNLAVFFPLALGGLLKFPASLFLGLEGFFIFSGAASSVYILNDLIDAAHDRKHSHKSTRPIAAREVGMASAIPFLLLLVAMVMASGYHLGLLLPLLLYFSCNILYSFIGKKLFLIDIILISFFFFLRVELGSILFKVSLPSTLLFFISIYFLGLAALKRYVEISSAEIQHRPYRKEHLPLMAALSLVCTTGALLFFAYYLATIGIGETYRHPRLLLFLPLIVAAANLRLSLKARRSQLPEDLSAFLTKDPLSWALLACCVLTLCLAR